MRRGFHVTLLTAGLLAGCVPSGRSTGGPRATGDDARAAGADANTLRLDVGGGVMLELVRVPAGEFMMGSSLGEVDYKEDEGPRHVVRFARPFYIGRYEVTQRQWAAVMGENPSWYKGDDLPVNKVNWSEAVEFCRQVQHVTGRAVRLPSEAEWEYACRAGTTTLYCFGDDAGRLSEYAWYRGGEGSPLRPSAVGQKRPNAWGLYDMHGNVWEWCADRYAPSYESAPDDGGPRRDGTQHVLRGGSWHNGPRFLRSAARLPRAGYFRSSYVGFRVALDAEGEDLGAGVGGRP